MGGVVFVITNALILINKITQQEVFDLIGNLLTQQLSEEGHQAVQRICQAAVYLESDTNIAKLEIDKALKAIRWYNVVEMYFPDVPKNKREKVITALKIEAQAQVNYWRGVDKAINHLASMPNIKLDNLTGIENVYEQPLMDTNVNSAILGLIQLQCPDMDAAQKRRFAKLIDITIERQNAVKI